MSTLKIIDADIDKAAELCGYDIFIPYKLVKDLSQILFLRIQHNDILNYSDYNLSLYELADLIKFELVDGKDLLEVVLTALKKASNSFNLREIESCAKSAIEIDYSQKGSKQMNYKFNLAEIPKSTLNMLDITLDGDYNTVEVSEEAQKILGFYDGGEFDAEGPIKQEEVVPIQMGNHSEIVKVKKVNYAMPHFKAKLGLKKFTFNNVVDVYKSQKDVILMFNCALSEKSDDLKFLYRAVILRYLEQMNDGMKIHIYFFARFINGSILNIDTVDKLKAAYNYKLTRNLMMSDKTEALAQAAREHRDSNIVVITANDIDFVKLRNANNKINAVCLKHCESLADLCYKTRGSYSEI